MTHEMLLHEKERPTLCQAMWQGPSQLKELATVGMSVCWKRHASDAGEHAMLLAQAVQALAASCARDLQGLNTRVHCPQNSETVDLSEGASSVRMVRVRAGRTLCLRAELHKLVWI